MAEIINNIPNFMTELIDDESRSVQIASAGDATCILVDLNCVNDDSVCVIFDFVCKN